jgi:hypothetical protein
MLCEQCSRINFFLTEDAKGYHHETVGKLHQSVLDGCEFCRVLYDGFQAGQGEEVDGDGFEEDECYLGYGYDRRRHVFNFIEAAQMRQTQVEDEFPRFYMISFRVYADEGMSCYCSLEVSWKGPVLC